MAKARRTQTWKRTKIPNLFVLAESGIYYGRVKPKGGKQLRKSLETKSLAVAREKLRDWLPSLKVVKRAATGTWGGVIEPYQAWLQGEKILDDIGASTPPLCPSPGSSVLAGFRADELKAQPAAERLGLSRA